MRNQKRHKNYHKNPKNNNIHPSSTDLLVLELSVGPHRLRDVTKWPNVTSRDKNLSQKDAKQFWKAAELSELKTALIVNDLESVSIKASVCRRLHMKLVEDRFYVWMSELKFSSRWSGGRWRRRARWSRCPSWTSRWRTLWGVTASSWFLLWSSATPWREAVLCTSSPPSRCPQRTWRSSWSWKVGRRRPGCKMLEKKMAASCWEHLSCAAKQEYKQGFWWCVTLTASLWLAALQRAFHLKSDWSEWGGSVSPRDELLCLSSRCGGDDRDHHAGPDLLHSWRDPVGEALRLHYDGGGRPVLRRLLQVRQHGSRQDVVPQRQGAGPDQGRAGGQLWRPAAGLGAGPSRQGRLSQRRPDLR